MVNELKYSRAKINEMHFEQLQRADKMVTLGELTAAMAHDINNHAAIIMSRADFLLLEAQKNIEKNNSVDDLEVIMDQIDKISSITGSILKHSKKQTSNFTEIDLVKLVENSLSMLKPIVKKSGVNLIEQIKVHRAIINGDANQLEQMILNLVSNALDAVKKGGDVKVTLSSIDKKYYELKVEDNGIGIDEQSLKKIFSPFYTNKAADKGTGLGLFIVEKICKEHNATIECESKVNFGSTFTITFKGGNENV
jgi:signal transduction histidine kinase